MAILLNYLLHKNVIEPFLIHGSFNVKRFAECGDKDERQNWILKKNELCKQHNHTRV